MSTLNQRFVFMPYQVCGCLLRCGDKMQVRHAYFVNVLRGLGDRTMLVFTSTCKSCEELAILLRELGFSCMGLHSQVPHNHTATL